MKLTREGRRFLPATLLIGFAAFNTGNNLIFLIFSMMLSFLVLSLVLLMLNMRRLTIRLSQDQPVYAQKTSRISITLRNRKQSMASYSMRVLISEDNSSAALFPRVAGASEATVGMPVRFRKRGRYQLGSFLIESTFPFILISRRKECPVEGEILVYPEITDIARMLPDPAETTTGALCTGRRGGEDFSRIREFRHGDDWRKIHWRASAKTGEFMVMEYTEEESNRTTIIFDNLKPHDTAAFEKSVSFTASIAERLIAQGYFVRLMTCRKLIPFGRGREHLFKILDVLALIEGQDSWECPVSSMPEGFTILILNSDASLLRKYHAMSDRIFYASDL